MKKVTLSAKILAAATVGFSVITLAPAANAASLVPNIEGEVKLTNGGCQTTATCIDTSSLGYTVTSLSYNPKNKESLLFVDDRSTENTYLKGSFGIHFLPEDEGTNPIAGEKWFRPVALDKKGNPLENGRLEVGRFQFNFLQPVNSLKLSFFDIEASGFSGIIEITQGGVKTVLNNFFNADHNSNIQYSSIFNNVDSIVVQLGQVKVAPFPKTGDGVSLQISVPEPGTMISLGALAVAGMFGVRKGKTVSQVG
ncbi:hypothetical protein NIES4101_54310 [Calothrix sp. NIES-4101]|nr:hypothetical protein NIES4101_54310 [Calothrix sp. NIES-4101]